MDLSVIILTHNSATTIAASIRSVLFAGKIIIVDSGSTDATLSICRRFPVQILSRPLNNDFAAQRNWAQKKTATSWVLHLDSDEIVSSGLAKEIQSAINNPDISGYFLKRQDFFLGRWLRHGETGHIRLLRLARPNKGLWQRPVHETWQIKGPLATLNSPLLHSPHPTLSDFIHNLNRYTSIDSTLRKTSRPLIYLQTISHPLAKFCLNYILRLGFLDGLPGLFHAYIMSLHSLIVRIKTYENNSA